MAVYYPWVPGAHGAQIPIVPSTVPGESYQGMTAASANLIWSNEWVPPGSSHSTSAKLTGQCLGLAVTSTYSGSGAVFPATGGITASSLVQGTWWRAYYKCVALPTGGNKAFAIAGSSPYGFQGLAVSGTGLLFMLYWYTSHTMYNRYLISGSHYTVAAGDTFRVEWRTTTGATSGTVLDVKFYKNANVNGTTPDTVYRWTGGAVSTNGPSPCYNAGSDWARPRPIGYFVHSTDGDFVNTAGVTRALGYDTSGYGTWHVSDVAFTDTIGVNDAPPPLTTPPAGPSLPLGVGISMPGA